MEQRLGLCKNLLEIQGMNLMSMNGIEDSPYMMGMYNGMELMVSILEDRKPEFCSILMEQEAEGVDEEMEGEECEIESRTMAGKIK